MAEKKAFEQDLKFGVKIMNTGRFLSIGLLFAFGFVANATAEAFKEEYIEGSHYHRIQPPQPTQSGEDRIEVVEMFFYACPLCNKLEPKINRWVQDQADDVDFRRMPAVVGPTWGDQAKAFYVAQKLGILDKTHQALFKSIHEDGHQYYNELSMMQFFAIQGVSEEEFLALFRLPEIVEQASQARVMTVRYGLKGVPAMIVNGKYITASYYTRNLDEMLRVVDMLIRKERGEMAAGAKQADQG